LLEANVYFMVYVSNEEPQVSVQINFDRAKHHIAFMVDRRIVSKVALESFEECEQTEARS
jgi:hypothetical protein